MKIYRKRLVTEHDPVFYQIDYESPLSVGNGNLAFTADPTGFQSFHEEFLKKGVPLCTMSSWGWHSSPDHGKEYTFDDLKFTDYSFNGRAVKYASEKQAGNEKIYDWLRENPHRLNLSVISLLYDGEPVRPEHIDNIQQHLHLYEGCLDSSFNLFGQSVQVRTSVVPDRDILLFSVRCPDSLEGHLSVRLTFDGGSPDISGYKALQDNGSSAENSASEAAGSHAFMGSSPASCNKLSLLSETSSSMVVNHIIDNDEVLTALSVEKSRKESLSSQVSVFDHALVINLSGGLNYLKIGFSLRAEKCGLSAEQLLVHDVEESFQALSERVKLFWQSFWDKGGIVSFEGSSDERAYELERRIILSQYLQAINCTGNIPPAETGLFCNSWYGKFHLEMHFWHTASLPQWSHPELMERSFSWYLLHLPQARENAARNGFKGARWPKMIAETALDSPSVIAVLLVWQQPHILYMLEQVYRCGRDRSFLEKYWSIVKESADFMADYAVKNEKSAVYELLPPLIPVQEEYDPRTVKNPAFEVSYWRYGLKIACEWAMRLEGKAPEAWIEVIEKMAPLPVTADSEGNVLYSSHENCPDVFTSFNKDHPSMLSSFSYFADERVEPDVMRRTLEKVLSCWNFQSLWGWDFAAMAMTAVRLGLKDLAVDLLLQDTPKNYYGPNGHNFQKTRTDLPAYLPGNGALLLAVAMMTAGYKGCLPEKGKTVGFPDNGKWCVNYEGILPLFS